MITPNRPALLSILMLAGSCAPTLSTASAQDVQPDLRVTPVVEQDRPRIPLTAELPWLIHRAALLDLRLNESPSPTDYEFASILLDLGLRMNPENAELARDLAQAAWLAGDSDRSLEATRQIIRADPSDTVAQLRLISARINEKQTLEQRKALYDRFLGEAGQSLDKSVRSRLALDAALLEREAGNTAAFLERLHQATRLDSSHKAAASLAAQYYSSVSRNPTVSLDYQVRLLKADPLDAHVHLSIADMLSANGASEEAKRYLYNAIKLFSLETGEPPENIEEIRIAIEWQTDGAEAAMAPLRAELNDLRTAARAQIDAYVEAQLPIDDLRQPLEIRFPLGVDMLRILAAHSEGDSELVRSILDDIQRTVSQDIAALAQAATQPGADVRTLLTLVVRRMTELNAMRAIVGLDTERISEEITVMREQMPALASQLRQVEAMIQYSKGNYEEAIREAEAFSSMPIHGLIRAASYERLEQDEKAIELYVGIARSNVKNAYGAYAHERLKKLGAADRFMTEAGQEMIRIASRLPEWVEQMIDRPSSFQYLSVDHQKRMYFEGERPMLTIRLQNTAPIPLSVGPNAPINSRVLIEPVGVSTQHNGFIGSPRPKVLQLDSRLRLEPRESVSIEVAADSVSTDWLIDQQAGISMRQRWRLIQGFRTRLSDSVAQVQGANPNQRVFGITNSPLGLTAETSVVQRLGLSVFRASASELAAMLESDDSDMHRRAMTAISARLINSRVDEQFDERGIDRITTALNELYTRSGAEVRAAMMLMLPQRHQAPGMMAFDDHVASSLLSDSLIDSEVDPLTLVCALLTRTDDPESPIFETLAQISDPDIKRFAQITRERLRGGEPLLSTVGPGVDAMIPTFDGLDQ